MNDTLHTLREKIQAWYKALPEITLPNIGSEDGTHMEINEDELVRFVEQEINRAREAELYAIKGQVGQLTHEEVLDKVDVIIEERLKALKPKNGTHRAFFKAGELTDSGKPKNGRQ